jgi:hypothetical protein
MIENFLLFFISFHLLFLLAFPHILWIRWIIVAFRRKGLIERIIGAVSYLLFLMPWLVIFHDISWSIKRNKEATLFADNFLMAIWLLSILIPILFFYGRWLYTPYCQKKRKIFILRLSFLLLVPAILVLLVSVQA